MEISVSIGELPSILKNKAFRMESTLGWVQQAVRQDPISLQKFKDR